MNGLHEALERIIQPILTHYVPNVQETENGTLSFDIAEMRRQFGWNSERFPKCEAEDFLRMIEHLEESSDLESILRALGSVFECQRVFAAVQALTGAEEILVPSVRLEASIPVELKAFRESVFERQWSEAIFEEYILPKEREDHAAYASLHLPPEKIEKRLQAILFSEIGDKVWTCDALQRVRKSGLEAIFSFVLTLDTQDHRVAVFERLDVRRQSFWNQ